MTRKRISAQANGGRTVYRGSLNIGTLAGLIVLLFGSTAGPSLSQEVVQPQALLAYMEQVRNDNGLPGLSVAVAVDGEIVFSEGVGVAELEHRIPATGQTVHNSGSVSKVIATVGLMQLVEEGRVDLDASIQTYLPYFPEKDQVITLRQILTHTSGLRHYAAGEFGPHRLQEMIHFQSFEESTRRWRDDPLVYDPGTFWMYSSYAFNLLHGVVEAVTGMGFEEYLRKHVFEPAGMTGTQFDVPGRIVHMRGRGYVREDGILIRPPYADVSYKYAGGGILASVEDLVRFGVALNAGRLMGPETVAEMYRVQLGTEIIAFAQDGGHSPLAFGQALGWRVQADPQGRRFVSHTGTVLGTRSFVGLYSEPSVVVAIQANSLPFDSEKYGRAILQMFLPATNRPSQAVPGGGDAGLGSRDSLNRADDGSRYRVDGRAGKGSGGPMSTPSS